MLSKASLQSTPSFPQSLPNLNYLLEGDVSQWWAGGGLFFEESVQNKVPSMNEISQRSTAILISACFLYFPTSMPFFFHARFLLDLFKGHFHQLQRLSKLQHFHFLTGGCARESFRKYKQRINAKIEETPCHCRCLIAFGLHQVKQSRDLNMNPAAGKTWWKDLLPSPNFSTLAQILLKFYTSIFPPSPFFICCSTFSSDDLLQHGLFVLLAWRVSES